MSWDNVEEACDILDKEQYPYILLLGNGNRTKIYANTGKDNLPMLEEWLETGHFNNILREHIKHIKSQ